MCCCVSGLEHGGGESDVFGTGAVFLTERNQPVERSRPVSAEPRLRSGAAQLLLRFLLLCASLHGGTSITEI